MGTEVQVENYLPGHYTTRDLRRESNGAGSWPSCYNNVNVPNGQYYYGFLPNTIADSHTGYDKDVMKLTILEHEVVFKDQVCELHRLYRVQRDLMNEVRRKEQFKRCMPDETLSSSSRLPSQMQSEDGQRCNGSNFPFASPVSGRPLISGSDNLLSSPNSVKGKSVQADQSPFQNCYSPKNSEVSESRPTKFRKRILNLELPAHEFIDIDEVEQFGRVKDFVNISSSPDENRKPASGNGRMFKPNALADLNEPFHVGETAAFSSVDFLSHAGCHRNVPYRDLPARLLSLSRDIPLNSKNGSLNGTLNNLQDIRGIGKDGIRYAFESELHIASAKYINEGLLPEKAPAGILLDQACQLPTFLMSDRIKGGPWESQSVSIPEKSDCSYPISNYNINGPVLASHAASQPSLFHSSDLGHSWDQSPTSWGKSNYPSQRPTSIQPSPFHLSAQSNGLLGNKGSLNCTPGANAAFVSEPPVKNGFCQGSSNAFKGPTPCIPPAGFDYANYNSENTVLHNSNNSLKATSSIDIHPVMEMNLNVALSNGKSDDYINPQGLKIIGKGCKTEDSFAALPWLKGKGAGNGSAHSRTGFNSLESVLSQGPFVGSSSCEANIKTKKSESSLKILGVSIFDNPPMPKEENHIDIVLSPPRYEELEVVKCKERKCLFDMNIPCEASDSEHDNMAVDEVVGSEKKEIRNHIDLNSCITEEETPCGTSLVYSSLSVKVGTGIDLEALINLENEDLILPVEDSSINEPKVQPDNRMDDGESELIKSAASSIVAISSCVDSTQASMEKTTCLPIEAQGDDPLYWFVSIACSSGNDDGLPEGLDDFECMILRQKECTPEEYLPNLSVPDFLAIENSTCVLTKTRTRKGQGRRGRQRRDFLRDILPGLTTLSRREVTEDFQTFGGLLGPNGRNAARNGRGRGRRRYVEETPAVVYTVCALTVKQERQVHSNNVEVVEDRSLTGWGKTIRRPRRQRCPPAGNPALMVPLS